jgi:hypothetical protein
VLHRLYADETEATSTDFSSNCLKCPDDVVIDLNRLPERMHRHLICREKKRDHTLHAKFGICVAMLTVQHDQFK